MKLQNNGPSVDVGANDIFARGEEREFDESVSAELLSRYPFISAVKVVKKESALKKAIRKLKKEHGI